jgi:hypothetical protein
MHTSGTISLISVALGALALVAAPGQQTPGNPSPAPLPPATVSQPVPPGPAQPQESPPPAPPATARDELAKGAATAWFASYLRAEIDALKDHSGVPFAWKGTELIETERDLAERYNDLVNAKGLRESSIVDATIVKSSSEIADRCVPQSYVIVRLTLGEGQMDVCVRHGEEPLVVGFSE